MVTELERERNALVKSRVDIAEGQERIDRQLALIGEMRAKGFDTGEGERLLDLLSQTLAHWERHHEMIVDRIAYLEKKAAAATAAQTPAKLSGIS